MLALRNMLRSRAPGEEAYTQGNRADGITFMNALFILNDPPYGTERLFNALRLAHALIKRETEVTVFLMADAVLAAKTGQKTPDGYYNTERMLRRVIAKGKVWLCGTCMDARGIGPDEVLDGAECSTMDALAEAVERADRVMVF